MIHFNAENDLSQEAEVTTMVRAICSIFTTFGNAVMSLESSSSASPIELKVLLSFLETNFRVFLACVHFVHVCNQ